MAILEEIDEMLFHCGNSMNYRAGAYTIYDCGSWAIRDVGFLMCQNGDVVASDEVELGGAGSEFIIFRRLYKCVSQSNAIIIQYPRA